MKIDNLQKVLLEMDRFYRRERDRKNLVSPIRTKHFLEDFAIILNLLELDKKINPLGKWAVKPLNKIFQLKKRTTKVRI